ncbi:PLP-dependent aminotransferase family protein [Marinomonas sp.]|nr:PLP-dependent aminotransferase family protein [Marinomonas sp.]
MDFHQDSFDQACLSLPKYKALVMLIEQAILAGELPDKQKLPAQRWLADKLGITHGTVTRAYDLLEKKGLVIAKLGAGTYVNFSVPSNQDTLEAQVQRGLKKEYDFACSMQPMLGQQTLVQNALSELAQDINAIEDVMTYAHQGVQKHKQIFTTWLASKQINIDTHDLVFTQGAQQGIYTCLQLLTKENDYVLHEALAYPGFFKAIDVCGVTPLSIPLTPEGLDLSVLESLCRQFKPKALYITPNLQNPTNIQYSQGQLASILQLSREYGFYIIEDDVNYCLPEMWRTPLQQQAPDRVFYLSSLSKYVAGGLRVAYTLVPKKWQLDFNAHVHSQCWMVSTLNFELASRFLSKDSFAHNQTLLAHEMRYRQDAFQVFADRHNLQVKSGGLNVWLTLPSAMNLNQFNGFLASKNIKVRTADLFMPLSSDVMPMNGLRISLGGFNIRAEFHEGVMAFEQAFIEFSQYQDVVI